MCVCEIIGGLVILAVFGVFGVGIGRVVASLVYDHRQVRAERELARLSRAPAHVRRFHFTHRGLSPG